MHFFDDSIRSSSDIVHCQPVLMSER
jgi:hypothetical protein